MATNKKTTAFVLQLFKDHNLGLTRFLTRKLADSEEAADVAQTAYQKLLARQDTADMENPKAYLYQTAVNLAIDRQRKNKHRESHLQGEKAMISSHGERTEASPETIIASRQELERVNEALNQLPDKCKKAFILHRGGHHSYRQIAAELEVSISMVEKYIIRALKHLRESLQQP